MLVEFHTLMLDLFNFFVYLQSFLIYGYFYNLMMTDFQNNVAPPVPPRPRRAQEVITSLTYFHPTLTSIDEVSILCSTFYHVISMVFI